MLIAKGESHVFKYIRRRNIWVSGLLIKFVMIYFMSKRKGTDPVTDVYEFNVN